MEKREARLKPVWVTHTTAATALGNDLDTSWEKLLRGETAIHTVGRFPTQRYPSRLAACIHDLSPSVNGSMIHPLIDRIISGIPVLPKETQLVTATTKGGIDILEQIRSGLRSDIGDSLPSGIPEYISKKLGLLNKGFNISAACASSSVAFSQSAMLIASGKIEVALILCLDLVTEFVFSGFSSLQILSPYPCRPFDRRRSGLSLGEGGAAILMMNADRARKYRYPCLAQAIGWGIAGDASHITAPARDGEGLNRAIGIALRNSGLRAEDIGAIHAHGTGTIYNDEMELTAFKKALDDLPIPIHSVKGAIGHTLGAAGGIEIAISIKSLSEQVIPPTVGLGKVMKAGIGRIRPEPVPLSGNCILKTNSGFGGINSAIILRKGER